VILESSRLSDNTILVAHFWRLEEQMSLSKASAGQATALDAELFAIQLGVVKATSFDIKCIVIITDSLTAARRAVDTSVHSGQTHSLTIVHAIKFGSTLLQYTEDNAQGRISRQPITTQHHYSNFNHFY